MPKITYSSETPTYFNVLSDGKFHQVVPEGTEGATRREYETSDGKKGVKFEILAETITGTIKNFSLFEGEYGKNVLIEFAKETEEDEQVIVSLSASSGFGEDFLKKVPNIDIEKVVTLAPYSFEDDNGKKRKGVTIYQGGIAPEFKIANYYVKEDKKLKKLVPTNGMPAPDGDTSKFDSDDWKLYFGTARKFLLGEFQKHPAFVEELKTEDKLDDEYDNF